jgi:subtilisin family serine protease
MYSFKYGGKDGAEHEVDIADDLVVVRTRDGMSLEEAITSPEAINTLSQFTPVTAFPESDVTILQGKDSRTRLVALRDQARRQFKEEEDIRFAGRVLRDEGGSGAPVVYTENFFVKFHEGTTAEKVNALLTKYNLTIKRELDYAENAFFVAAEDGTGLEIFPIAKDLLAEEEVELCHPEIIRQVSRRQIGPNQWHLQPTAVDGAQVNAQVNVAAAWQVTKGAGIVIAIIDDGVDIDHEEFASAGKIVAPRDATDRTDDPRPKDRSYSEDHGTACAGVACADGNHHASGVAPEAKLMPIRLVSNLGSQSEADAFVWAADNGADVISCSWGPKDGEWWNPSDATHNQIVHLPDSTRLAIDYAVSNGRNGKGCVITWAAGNGNEQIENDGYASYDKVVAVAASNDRNRRSVYSDFGAAIWCAFPSNDFGYTPFNHPNPITPGIWTTDREGTHGYTPGLLNPSSPPPGDDHGNYTAEFGGTSSACPGIAGIAALILSANPALNWQEVKDILRQSATRIDENNGSYDAQGHSPFYGYGRPDAGLAVQLATGSTDVEELVLGAKASGNLPEAGAEKLFSATLESKATLTLDGPDGVDFDLYVKREAAPTADEFDLRSWTSEPDEALTIDPETPGKYFILVRSYQGGGDFELNLDPIS